MDTPKRITVHRMDGVRLEDFYQIDNGPPLGRGASGVVKIAKRKRDGAKMAVKIVEKRRARETGHLATLETELDVLCRVHHPHVVHVHDIFEDQKQACVVMELVKGGELFDRLRQRIVYTEKDAREVTRRLLEAVCYLHELNIVHRDLKPENILLTGVDDDFDIRLADFGLSQVISQGETIQTAVGTPGFVAPEVLRCHIVSENGYGKPSDMWSVGVIVYLLLAGFPPFWDYDGNEAALFRQIMRAEVEFPKDAWDEISMEAQAFILKLLVANPSQRLTAEEALKDPWIVGPPPDVHLSHTLERLKSFAARRKFKGAGYYVMAARLFSQIPLEVQERSASKIAAVARGAAARKRVRKMFQDRAMAAILLQRAVRRYQERKRKGKQ